jgi:hypothetical protein
MLTLLLLNQKGRMCCSMETKCLDLESITLKNKHKIPLELKFGKQQLEHLDAQRSDFQKLKPMKTQVQPITRTNLPTTGVTLNT